MEQPADFQLRDTPNGIVALLTGDWTAVGMGLASERLVKALEGAQTVTIDLTGVGRCDTTGAWGVLRAAEASAETGHIVAPAALEMLERAGIETIVVSTADTAARATSAA